VTKVTPLSKVYCFAPPGTIPPGAVLFLPELGPLNGGPFFLPALRPIVIEAHTAGPSRYNAHGLPMLQRRLRQA